MLKILVAALLALVSTAALAGSNDGSQDQKPTCEEQLGPNVFRFPGKVRAPITLNLTAEQEANPFANVVEIFGSIGPYKTFFVDGTHGNDPYFPNVDFNYYRLVQLTRPIYDNPVAGRWMVILRTRISDGELYTSLLELQDLIHRPSVGTSIEARERVLAIALKSTFEIDFNSAKMLANDFYKMRVRPGISSGVETLARLLTKFLDDQDVLIEIYDEKGRVRSF